MKSLILPAIFLFFLASTLILSACSSLETPELAPATARPTPHLATATPDPVIPVTRQGGGNANLTAQSFVTPGPSFGSTPVSSKRPNTPVKPATTTQALTPQRTSSSYGSFFFPTLTPQPSARITEARTNRPIGGDLIGASDREITTFQPYGTADKVSEEYRALVYSAQLIRRNSQHFEWEPNAAQSFVYDDKRLTVTFVLKPGIKWSDGSLITSSDYTWTYTQAIDPGKNWTGAALYSNTVESYSAPDSRTIIVKLKGQFSDPLGLANFVEPLPKAVWEGKSWSETDRNPELLNPTVISGPWKFKELVRGHKISFTRNENSTILPPPFINSLTFLYISDSREALGMLSRGEIDFFVPPSDRYADMRDASKVVTYLWDAPDAQWNYLGFNFRRQLTGDQAFRKALANVTNREDIIKGAGQGRGTPLYSDVPPGNPAFQPNVEKYDGGLAQAKSILKAAGYSWRDGDQLLLDPKGQEVPELTLVFNIESQLRTKLAEYFQGQLALLGVRSRTVGFDFLSYVNQLTKPPYDYDLFLGGWKPVSPDIATFGQTLKNNFSGYFNVELSNLYEKAAQEPDKLLRYALLSRIQQLEARELPDIYLFAERDSLGALYSVGGITAEPLGIAGDLFTSWYIKQ